jgi:hypothetical protein
MNSPMRPPRILDVIRAAKVVAAAHPDVSAWWYAPQRRLSVSGQTSASSIEVEVAIESAPRSSPDRTRIARELSDALRVPGVSVRPYRGADEERALFRLISR